MRTHPIDERMPSVHSLSEIEQDNMDGASASCSSHGHRKPSTSITVSSSGRSSAGSRGSNSTHGGDPNKGASLLSHSSSLPESFQDSLHGCHSGLFLAEPTSLNNTQERASRATQDMTINKLRFSSLGLIGRSQEISTLEACATRAQETKTRESVLIYGESGTGKTALAKSIEANALRRIRTNANQTLFISGKFDLLLRDNEPYAGIAGACRELCGELLMLRGKEPERFQTISTRITKELGQSELAVLHKIIPELEEVFDEASVDHQSHLSQQAQQGASSETKHQILFAFRRLFRTLSGVFSSLVVLTLDDLQWADFASLELLELLLTDDQIQNFLVIGCYRANEVGPAHILSQTTRDLQGKTNDAFHITEISIGNLQVPHVEELLMELLSHDNGPQIQTLAQICHKKTLGNAFFLIHFISHLHEEGLLTYNLGCFQWTWKQDDIMARTGATANVIDLLKQKMMQLPPCAHTLLAILACLGSEFQQGLAQLAWDSYSKDEHESDPDGAPPPLNDLLKAAIQEGFLEGNTSSKSCATSCCNWKEKTTSYRFVHDKVQEVALLFVDPDKLLQLKSTVGHIVLQELQTGTIPGHLLFVAVNLLNESAPSNSTCTQEQKVQLANLNLQAAQKAVESSAFASASQYVQKGVDLMPQKDMWSQQFYAMTLELHSLGAELEALLGHDEAMQSYCDQVLNQTDAPMTDKFRVYNVMQDSLVNRNHHAEAMKLGLDVAKKLGVHFPKRKVSVHLKIFVGLFKARMGLKNKVSPEAIENLPSMTDPIKLQLMRVLDKCLTCSVTGGDNKLVPLLILENYYLTMKYGLCQYSPPALAALGIIMVGALEDFEGVAKISDCMEVMMGKMECQSNFARSNFILNTFVSPWIKPIQSLLKPSMNGYYVGLSAGDPENAMWNFNSYTIYGFYCGKSIPLLAADNAIYVKQMMELKQLNIAALNQLFQQMLAELSGSAEETTIFLSVESYPGFDTLTPINIHALKNFQSHLCAIFGDHSRGAELSMQRGDTMSKAAPGHFLNIPDAFYRGVSLFAHARATKQRKWGKLAKKERSTINSWASKGNPNVAHYKYLLDAEYKALKGHNEEANKLYQKAIVMVARLGFVQDAALANERFADFLLHEVKDRETAAFRMREAHRFYTEWGAHRKVELLEEAYPDLLPQPKDIVVLGQANEESYLCAGTEKLVLGHHE